jgi:predicted MFS family arabinose efflux permease
LTTNSISPRHSPFIVATAGAFVIAAAMGIGRFAYTPLLPGMQETLGWSVAQAGDVASANYLGYMLGAMLASLLVHRPQRHFGLLGGMFFSGLTTLACAWITSYPLWLSLRFLSGVASAFCLVLGSAVVMELTARHSRPQLGSLYFGGLSLGIIGSVVIIESARYLHYSIFAQWGLLGIMSLIMLALAWMVLRYHTRDSDSFLSQQSGQAEQSSSASLRGLIVAYGLFGFGYVVTATFIVAIARQFDNAEVLEPTTWLVVGLVGAPSIFIWQSLSTRIGVFKALRIAYAIEAIGVLLAGIASSAFAVVLGGALLGATFMAITAMGLNAARQVAGANQDKAIAWMTVSFGLGQLLGPALAGRMAEMTESFAAPSALAAVLLIVGMMLIKDQRMKVSPGN